MKYFNSLPLITTTDYKGNSYQLRNLMIRTQLIPELNKNPLLFYNYELRDGDTPEIVANKYYGNPYRYWIVMYGNPQMMDPQGNWPLSSQQFEAYLNNKYFDVANTAQQTVLQYIQSTTHHYEKVITTVDNETQTTVIKNIQIDFDTYTNLIPMTATNSFSDGTSVNISISKSLVTIYDYENLLNESKRNIQLINSSYINQMETQYQKLVRI